MRLYNPSKHLVFLRDDIKKTLITLKPEESISVEPHLRQSFSTYVQSFGLQWLLDDVDLPHGMDTGTVKGSHAYHQRHKNDSVELQESTPTTVDDEGADAREIAQLWREQDTLRFVPHELPSHKPGATFSPNDSENFIFPQKITEHEDEERRPVHEISVITSKEDFRNAFVSGDADPEGFLSDDVGDTPPGPEGPSYLRNALFHKELEGFGKNEIGENNEGEESTEDDQALPDDAPVTISQLQLSTKSQLFEMCDKLGIDSSGSKKDIIKKMCQYYWQVHYTKVQLNK